MSKTDKDKCKSAEKPAKRRKPRKRRREAADQVDLEAILKEPLDVLKNGKPGKMDPIEAAVRRQVQKALVEKNFASIKAVIDLAIEHKLVARPDPPKAGGVLLIPSDLPEFDAIFNEHWTDMGKIFAALRRYYD